MNSSDKFGIYRQCECEGKTDRSGGNYLSQGLMAGNCDAATTDNNKGRFSRWMALAASRGTTI